MTDDHRASNPGVDGPTEAARAAEDDRIRGNQDDEFIAYPTNRVVGFIDDANDAKGAIEDLHEAGFQSDEMVVLAGEAGARRLDATAPGRGWFPKVVRALQRINDYETAYARRHQEELQAGHIGVGVIVWTEDERLRVRDILKAHQGHFIHYFGALVIEQLQP